MPAEDGVVSSFVLYPASEETAFQRIAQAGLWRDLGLVFTTEVGTSLN